MKTTNGFEISKDLLEKVTAWKVYSDSGSWSEGVNYKIYSFKRNTGKQAIEKASKFTNKKLHIKLLTIYAETFEIDQNTL